MSPELLSTIRGYLNQRADVKGDSEHLQPNEAMYLFVRIEHEGMTQDVIDELIEYFTNEDTDESRSILARIAAEGESK